MALWWRTDGEDGIPPISEGLDHDLMMMQIAKELNVPVTAMDDMPLHWIGAAHVAMAWNRYEMEKITKRSRRGSSATQKRVR